MRRLVVCLLVACAPHILASKLPVPLASDARVKQVAYDPNQIYALAGSYGYQTAIEFGHDETVKLVSLGDSIAWQTVPYQNRLFIKPVEPNARTNLTVMTDKHSYYFTLSSSPGRAGKTFLLRFVYPEQTGRGGDGTGRRAASAALNFDYGLSGDRRTIPLQRVFDDGEFTFFQFESGAEIPAVYSVGEDGRESIVNTRREGHYLVVERIARRFTLRNGRAHLCVSNMTRSSPHPVPDPPRYRGGR